MFGLDSGQYYWIDIVISLIIFVIGLGIGYSIKSKKQVVKEMKEEIL